MKIVYKFVTISHSIFFDSILLDKISWWLSLLLWEFLFYGSELTSLFILGSLALLCLLLTFPSWFTATQ